mgnify:CR=1 FL=1
MEKKIILIACVVLIVLGALLWILTLSNTPDPSLCDKSSAESFGDCIERQMNEDASADSPLRLAGYILIVLGLIPLYMFYLHIYLKNLLKKS